MMLGMYAKFCDFFVDRLSANVRRGMRGAAAADAPVLFPRNPAAPPHQRRPLNQTAVLNRVKRLATSLGLPAGQSQGGWTPHLLRHCFESFAVNRRVPQRAVDVWLGHLGDAESLRHIKALKLPAT